jgi:EAL domain-containing protein (putative c-di-GMP-specific phosphodiesterase class I)
VLQQALAFVDELTACGCATTQVHINVRPRQLSATGFARDMLSSCVAADVSPSRLGIEVTESDLLHVGPIALDNLGILRRAGVHVAIDDFGTGFSSLSHLLELPVDALKIDRRFIDRLETDPTSKGLTAAIIGLADTLGLRCVAEGVETQAQRNALVAMGRTLIQGHLYGPALPAEAAHEVAASAPWRAKSVPANDVNSVGGTDRNNVR